MRILTLTLLLAAPLLGSCGSADPAQKTNAGYQALGSGDFETAVADFDAALAEMDPGHKDYLRAKMGQIEANTQVNPTQAKDDFLALAESMPSKVDDRHFNQIGGRLSEAGATTEAIALLEVGMKAHPESPHLQKLLTAVGDRAAKGDDPAALAALKSLGYVGD